MLLFPLQQLFYRESLCVRYLANGIPACDSLSFLSHLPENLVVLAASNCNSWQCKIILWNCPGRDSVLCFRPYQHQWMIFYYGNSGSWPEYQGAELREGPLLWPVCPLPLAKNCFSHLLAKDIHFMTVHKRLMKLKIYFKILNANHSKASLESNYRTSRLSFSPPFPPYKSHKNSGIQKMFYSVPHFLPYVLNSWVNFGT